MTGTQQGRRLLILVNNPAFFLSHRLEIAQAALAAGYEVHIATMDGPAVAQIRAHGFKHHVIPMTRSGKNPFQELRTLFSLWRLMRRLRPQVVHAVTIKPVLYGGIAARFAGAGVGPFLAAISGLGYLFTRDTGWQRRIALGLYGLALGRPSTRVIVQNKSDQQMLVRAGVVQEKQCVLIPGSGVDINKFELTPEPKEPITLVMAARLLHDKGVQEYIQAAQWAQAQGYDWRWQIAGPVDPGNPASLTEDEIRGWHDAGVVQWLGERQDIDVLYRQAHIVVLPSYREGLPKSLIEAAASGRAVVTTDVPGCRDAIIADQTGLLVPVRDSQALAKAIEQLALDKALRRQLGAAGRQLAEERFDVAQVVRAHLELYSDLAQKSATAD
ncbi:MAG TPA: glycosyltransferase family 4 protein [Paenalcaligenes sp.]|nr:glycosyltransferase family 4 protein [Paenalcaligenes sp.]